MLKHLILKSHKPASANDATILIDALYRQIMADAFSKFKDEFLTCRLRILYTFLCTAERTSTSIAAALVAEGDDDVAIAIVEELPPRSVIHPRRSRFLVSYFLPRLHF